jgi:hypothetical protein
MSIPVDGIAVPVIWKPSDLTGPDSDGHAGRSGHPIRAIVHHRVVGSLESMVNSTFRPTTDDRLTLGERRVSSHFGIGFWDTSTGTQLRVYQFVALENTAYCNGQSATDRAACTWPLWINAGKPPTNEITVSIEHEDNGKAGGYVVREEIIRASIELDRLLLSGDGKAIRAAGIHCTDAAAAMLGKIKPSAQTLVDHKTVAPVSKPYCWRAIGNDDGFPQARYIAALTAPEVDTVNSYPVPTVPSVVMVPTGTWLYATNALEPNAANIQVDPARELPYLGAPSSTTRIVEYVNASGVHSGKAMFVKATEIGTIRELPAPVTDCAAAVAAALSPVQAAADLATAMLADAPGKERERIALAEADRIRGI